MELLWDWLHIFLYLWLTNVVCGFVFVVLTFVFVFVCQAFYVKAGAFCWVDWSHPKIVRNKLQSWLGSNSKLAHGGQKINWMTTAGCYHLSRSHWHTIHKKMAKGQTDPGSTILIWRDTPLFTNSNKMKTKEWWW